MEKLDFNENQSVFRVGESSDKMFLLVKGKVGIFLPKNETKDADFFVEENELFGEMGIIAVSYTHLTLPTSVPV